MNSMLLKIKFFFLLFLGISLQLWAQIPDGYYDSALGKKKAELKTALHKIIGKADVLDYGSGAGKTWSGFVQTDVFAQPSKSQRKLCRIGNEYRTLFRKELVGRHKKSSI